MSWKVEWRSASEESGALFAVMCLTNLLQLSVDSWDILHGVRNLVVCIKQLCLSHFLLQMLKVAHMNQEPDLYFWKTFSVLDLSYCLLTAVILELISFLLTAVIQGQMLVSFAKVFASIEYGACKQANCIDTYSFRTCMQ